MRFSWGESNIRCSLPLTFFIEVLMAAYTRYPRFNWRIQAQFLRVLLILMNYNNTRIDNFHNKVFHQKMNYI